MREYIPQQEKFDNFSDLINAATTQYTLSFKDACKALKCSRSWAQKYIRHNVPNIYLTNGKGTGKANYAKLVSLAVNKQIGEEGYSNESVYLDEKAFNKFVYDSIVSCKKRSKQIYKSFFINPEDIENYYKELLALYFSFRNIRMSKEDTEKKWEQINSVYLKYAKNKHVKTIIHPAIVYQTKRTEAEFIDVPVPDVPIEEWQAVHDIMEYGDIEETIYRHLFKDGYIRIEIKMPDKNGVIKSTGKVYYVADPEPVVAINLNESIIEHILDSYNGDNKGIATDLLINLINNDRINIKQSAWVEYNNMLGNNITY